MSAIEVALDNGEAGQLWTSLGELADRLPGGWVLIGGLMVQLHAAEHGIRDVRLTRDIDILGQARPPGALAAIDLALQAAGFKLTGPDLDGFAHRYERGDLIVDLLAPDGLKPPPEMAGGLKAVGVPGGSQALARSELVKVRVDGREFALRRPSLVGAILIKARSIMRHADPLSQRDDLLRLLALVDDPRAAAGDLKRAERTWLRRSEERLDFAGVTVLDDATVRTALLAYRMLVRDV